ncbi:MAG: ABC transporter substrate binding protein, partial [Candidatus Rokuibacteriota bacterium]
VLTDGVNPVFHLAGVLAYASNQGERAARVAYYVDRVLRGANPGELPIEQPTQYELSVNLKIAKSIGLAVPQSILARADRVFD